MGMVPDMILAIVGENSTISRIFGAIDSDESVNVEILTDAAGHALTDGSGNVLIGGLAVYALTDENGAALIDGSGNYLMAN